MKNMQQMLKQAQKMQEELQKQMAEMSIEGTAGGGMVCIKMNGLKQVLSVKIEPDAITSGDVEMLQDLVVVAVNEAIDKSQQLASSRMGELTGGLGLPNILG